MSNAREFVYDSNDRGIPIFGLLRRIPANRDLIYILLKKELTVRYKKSIIGVWWSLLNPLLTTAVLFYVFNTAFKNTLTVSSHFIPYILCGVLIITFFNQSLTMVSDSIMGNASIFTKMYVRPEMFAIAASLSAAINFIFGLVPLVVVALLGGVKISVSSLAVMYVLACMVLISIGLGLMCAISYIFFEDFRSIISLILMVLGYMTPVFYPISVLGPHTRPVIEANPLTSVLAVFRSTFGNLESATSGNWLFAGFFSIGIFLLGIYIFEKLWPKAVVKL